MKTDHGSKILTKDEKVEEDILEEEKNKEPSLKEEFKQLFLCPNCALEKRIHGSQGGSRE